MKYKFDFMNGIRLVCKELTKRQKVCHMAYMITVTLIMKVSPTEAAIHLSWQRRHRNREYATWVMCMWAA
jgi:hypothetical protein